jgi:hypothetical protein
LRKSTRNRLRQLAIARRESYDEIISRLLGTENEGHDDLEKKKQKLLKMGISKEIVDLVGIMPKINLNEEKSIIRRAIIRRESR